MLKAQIHFVKMDKFFLEIPISTLLSENGFRTTFSVSESEAVEIPESDIKQALLDVNGRLNLKLKSGICSEILKKQLALHQLQFGERYGDQIHFYHYQTILDTIETNENGNSVNLRPFTRNPLLKDVYHIHHNSSTYIKENVINVWNKKKKGKDEIVFQNQLLNEVYLELIKTHTEEFARQKSLGVLLNKIHNESIFKDFKDKTGEWIVCLFHDERWIYLCLAAHDEGDEKIVEKVQEALKEFPELVK